MTFAEIWELSSNKLKFGMMNWVQRKIYLYNVTFGLYMLDWWERFLFNTLVVVLMWFVCYNGVRSSAEFFKRILW
ncbi:Small subunit of serine palmitoyltransferase-like protein [Actinidia chinensis var. chinensis]|uniref:Small subunit of serine palmitoyltransferase-like protein n=1 Tax=Actinidia chinensis var. chinensis TaxID=1590841 RepID=A0A2R6R5U6_ACTCC|nr:Small subunit of serine palmitoyltransferase-like protein [Actinidia chinensis var. chinensis]